MTAPETATHATPADLPNGPGAAAVLAAGIGSFAVGVFAVLGDKSAAFKTLFNLYKPTGPLSGVTTAAILVWLLVWAVLNAVWRRRDISMGRINAVAFALLALGLLLTFPPIVDLF